jgi:hypothetical protein
VRLNSAFGSEKVDQKSYDSTIKLTESRSRPEARNFEVIKRSKPSVPLSSWSVRQTVCSKFSRSGWSVVRSASLAKGGTSKKRPSPHFHEVPTRGNKVSPRTFQTALAIITKFPKYCKLWVHTWCFQPLYNSVRSMKNSVKPIYLDANHLFTLCKR